MRIRIVVTGGTFDKEYDELTGRLYFRTTHVPEMLVRGRCRLPVVVETAMMIDSLDLDEVGRAAIVRRCRSCREQAIVVTHGTDTMVETARALAAAKLPGKTIVLTGAMVPYAFGSSDGLFNLGSALSFVQVLAPGIYIAMNGRHFPWDRVRKNRKAGIFEAVAEARPRTPRGAEKLDQDTRRRRKGASERQGAAREDRRRRRKGASERQGAAREDRRRRRKGAFERQGAARED